MTIASHGDCPSRPRSLRREKTAHGRVVSTFVERPCGLDAMLVAAARAEPDRCAFVCSADRLTYRAFERAVARLAGGLCAAGLKPGDRVAVAVGNCSEFLLLTFAVARAGGVLVPISEREPAPGIAHILADSGAAFLFARAAMNRIDGVRRQVVLDGDDWRALLDADPLPPHAEDEDSIAALLYTSGTTGRAKGVPLSHRAIVHSATNYVDAMGLGPRDRSIAAVPFSHVTGLVALIATMVRAAGTLVVLPRFTAAAFLDTAEREAMTHTVMVPAMYNLCLLTEGFAARDLSAWRVAGFGGAPMPPATIGRLRSVAPDLVLMNLYGATETASPAVIMPPSVADRHDDAAGRAVPGCEIVVMDEGGREVAPGEAGELWIRGPMVTRGYWGVAPAPTDFIDGFWRSGDWGSIDADGMVRMIGRLKETINRGGYKVYPSELEYALAAWPGVAEAAVVPRHCDVLGQRPHAVVVARDPGARPDAEAMRRHLAARFADYKVPDSWDVRDEPLPRNANGKVDKRAIAAAVPPYRHAGASQPPKHRLG